MVQLRGNSGPNTFFSLSSMHRFVPNTDPFEVARVLWNDWGLLTERYHTMKYFEIFVMLFSWSVSLTELNQLHNSIKYFSKDSDILDETNTLNYYFKGCHFPFSMNPEDWSNSIVYKTKSNGYFTYTYLNKFTYLVNFTIISSSEFYSVHWDIISDNRVIMKFHDITTDFSLKDFTRNLYDISYFNRYNSLRKNIAINFIDNDVSSYSKYYYKDFIKPLIALDSEEKLNSTKFLTMDLETFTIDCIFKVFAIGIYDGEQTSIFYLSDFKSEKAMLRKAIKSIFIPKYRNYIVYLHNFSKFDAIFLLEELSKSGQINITMRSDRIISLIVENYKDSKMNLRFVDSYQLIPSSLASLAKSFNVEVQKGIFPYEFASPQTLNFIGKLPEKFLQNIPNEFQKEFSSSVWSFRDSLYNYLTKDLISLYQVIRSFSKTYFEVNKINIHKYPT